MTVFESAPKFRGELLSPYPAGPIESRTFSVGIPSAKAIASSACAMSSISTSQGPLEFGLSDDSARLAMWVSSGVPCSNRHTSYRKTVDRPDTWRCMLPRQLQQKKGLALELTRWCQQLAPLGIVSLQATHLALPVAISTVIVSLRWVAGAGRRPPSPTCGREGDPMNTKREGCWEGS